jgi:opacity protein-like surface antigen
VFNKRKGKNMKRTFTTLAILAAAVSSAVAADLPSKKIPTPPAPLFTQLNNYAGVNIGMDTADHTVYSGGIAVGTNVLPYLAVEAAYDFGYQKDKIKGKREIQNELFVNAIPQYKIPGMDVTAYFLGGVGYDWSSVKKNHALYNVGGGVKYDFARNFDVDARYRYIDSLDEKFKVEDNRFTLGVNYKF